MVGQSEASQTKEPRGDCSVASLYNGLKTPVVMYNGLLTVLGVLKTSNQGSNPSLSAN
jgi:hypothetical protein